MVSSGVTSCTVWKLHLRFSLGDSFKRYTRITTDLLFGIPAFPLASFPLSFWRPGIRFCCLERAGGLHGGKPARHADQLSPHRAACGDARSRVWEQRPGSGNPAGRRSFFLLASGAQPPPSPVLLYPRLPPPCSPWPPWAQPIRRERSQQAPANRRPVFAGTAKPLGEKQ